MEMVSFIDAMGRIYNYEQARVNRGAWWRRLFGAIRHGVSSCTTRCRLHSSASRTKKHPGLKRSLCTCFHSCSVTLHPKPPYCSRIYYSRPSTTSCIVSQSPATRPQYNPDASEKQASVSGTHKTDSMGSWKKII
jgi:hypothetical protein